MSLILDVANLNLFQCVLLSFLFLRTVSLSLFEDILLQLFLSPQDFCSFLLHLFEVSFSLLLHLFETVSILGHKIYFLLRLSLHDYFFLIVLSLCSWAHNLTCL